MTQHGSTRKKGPTKKYPTVGACGLDCGLCPRFYTVGPSRCPGCGGPDFSNKHPSCSFITCCVKTKGLEACGECSDFPCPKFQTEEEYDKVKASSSYPMYRKLMPNQRFIKENGIKEFIGIQRQRITILERMLKEFDDGRSRSYFCKAANLLDLDVLKSSLIEADRIIKSEVIEKGDVKKKAKVLKSILDERL